MNRIKLFLILMSYTTAIFAYEKLNSYNSIKDALINGKNVKVVFDLNHDCTSVKNHKITFASSSSIVGMPFNQFAMNEDTLAIQTQAKFLNPVEEGGPFKFTAYNTGEVAVYPDNTVKFDTAIISLPDYKTVDIEHLNCKMSTSNNAAGARFFAD